MALMDCVDCGKQISSMAAACPHCGCPIPTAFGVAGNSVREPKLPSNLLVHTDVSGFGLTPATITGKISHPCEIQGSSPGGRVSIIRMKEGLYIDGLDDDFVVVHYAQVVAAQYFGGLKVKQESKSVLGRAAVGAVLLGPLGAVVGGMSGLGKTQKSINGIGLTFWNRSAKRYDTLILECNTNGLESFCNLIAKESAPYRAIHAEVMSN